jgi:multiple sugar transport system permease protein
MGRDKLAKQHYVERAPAGSKDLKSLLLSVHFGRPAFLSSMRFHLFISDLFIMVFAITGMVTMFLPIIWMAISGFKTVHEVQAIPPQFFPQTWQWENYLAVWQVTPLARSFVNSMFVGLCQVAGVVITSTVAGYAFARLRFPGRDLMFILILSTLMIPFFLQAIPLFVIMARLGWINTYQAQIVPFLASGFGIFLMRQFILTVPGELVDAARIDGCSEFGVVWRVVMPLVKSAVAALAIFTFISSWQDLFWPLLVAKQEEYYPIQQAIYYVRGQYQRSENLLMAAGTLAIVPPLIMFMILQERMVQGIALTGLKG